MKAVNKERQRRWKMKQASEGKKPVTVMISATVKDLIDRERKRTGETIAGIIEKAVNSLFKPSPRDSITQRPAGANNDKLEFIRNHPDGKKIFQLAGMYYNSGANAQSIVSILNRAECKTFSGNDEWTEEEAKEILEIVENDRLLYLQVAHSIE